MMIRARTVELLIDEAQRLDPVRKGDLRCGDRVLVSTENSVYSIAVLEDATFVVSGGWFDRQGLSPARVSIVGCTWGGSAIARDVLAARGLSLEFGNRVVTSRIRQVRVIRGAVPNLRALRAVQAGELLRACYGEGSERS